MPQMQAGDILYQGLSVYCGVNADGTGEPGSRRGEQNAPDVPQCPICQVLQNLGVFLSPIQGGAALLLRLTAAGQAPADFALSPTSVSASCRARAPPVQA